MLKITLGLRSTVHWGVQILKIKNIGFFVPKQKPIKTHILSTVISMVAFNNKLMWSNYTRDSRRRDREVGPGHG